MVDETQQTSSLQQPTNSGTGGNQTTQNPQQIGSSSLQIPGGSNLQVTSNQSVSGLNQIDQGAAAIPLSNVSASQAPASTTQPSKPATKHSTVYVYSGGAVLVLVIFGYMVYSLLRKH